MALLQHRVYYTRTKHPSGTNIFPDNNIFFCFLARSLHISMLLLLVSRCKRCLRGRIIIDKHSSFDATDKDWCSHFKVIHKHFDVAMQLPQRTCWRCRINFINLKRVLKANNNARNMIQFFAKKNIRTQCVVKNDCLHIAIHRCGCKHPKQQNAYQAIPYTGSFASKVKLFGWDFRSSMTSNAN